MSIVAVTLKAKGLSDRGLVRSTNQDALAMDQKLGLFMVADGMGGHAGGEIASNICIQEVQAFLAKSQKGLTLDPKTSHPYPLLQKALVDAVNSASAKIYGRALEEPSLKGMGTTATVLKVVEGFAYCAHVGDSRLYLMRCGYIYQITGDHSLVSEQVQAGLLTEEEAKEHQLRNVITRSVGYQEEEYVDTFCFALRHEDLLLLCSDGLSGKLKNKEISQHCKKHGLEAVPKLVDLAKTRGGEDNITVVLIQVTI